MRKWILPAAVVLSVSVTARVSSRDTAPLTTMDYVRLRQLVARHAWALDSGADNGYAFADLFTPDGEFVDPDAKGRDQLAALARGGRRGGAPTSIGGRYEDVYLRTSATSRRRTARASRHAALSDRFQALSSGSAGCAPMFGQRRRERRALVNRWTA
jgi:hypothetical protein